MRGQTIEGIGLPEGGDIRAVLSGYSIISTEGTRATMVANSNACVTFRRAALFLPFDSWMEATTEHPAPIISPNPVKSISRGMQIFMAAIPSLPTPWPTKIPSMAVTVDMLSIPSKVGMKYFLNRVNTFSVLKSIASLFIFMLSFRVILRNRMKPKKPDKLIGFTQSSYPAFASDEDYKT